MSKEEVFDSAVRSRGDQAGVFEFDGETSYFYLYQVQGEGGQKVRAAIHVHADNLNLREEDVRIIWNSVESRVGLVIRGRLCAVFDLATGEKYGGNCLSDGTSTIPEEVASDFK